MEAEDLDLAHKILDPDCAEEFDTDAKKGLTPFDFILQAYPKLTKISTTMAIMILGQNFHTSFSDQQGMFELGWSFSIHSDSGPVIRPI